MVLVLLHKEIIMIKKILFIFSFLMMSLLNAATDLTSQAYYMSLHKKRFIINADCLRAMAALLTQKRELRYAKTLVRGYLISQDPDVFALLSQVTYLRMQVRGLERSSIVSKLDPKLLALQNKLSKKERALELEKANI